MKHQNKRVENQTSKQPVEKLSTHGETSASFESMDLYKPLKRAIAEEGYVTPTPIQLKTIPAAVGGKDVLGCAQTGTGKTAAFALPVLDYIAGDRLRARPGKPIALVLAPTRELAIQISEALQVYGRHTKVRHVTIYGGVNQNRQVQRLAGGAEVMIATPGRLMDLMQQGHIDLSDVEMFVLDEADRMLDMGFLPAIKTIVKALPRERQSLFFSATLAPNIRQLASQLLFNPISVDVTPKVSSVKKIKQVVRIIPRSEKVKALQALLLDDAPKAIVFTRTKRGANALAAKLQRASVQAVAIHGNKSQNARQRALDGFKDEKIQVLVATDVAARGIDIDGVTHVVNFDMPSEPESYVHRIGRTGRAGADGIAISFCTVDEVDQLREIEKLIQHKLGVENPQNLSLVAENGSAPSPAGRGRSRGRGAARKRGADRNQSGAGNQPGGRSRSNRGKRPRRHAASGRPGGPGN